MSRLFTHGYALLIGVGETASRQYSLPVTVKDVQVLHAVLTDSELCAYPDDEQHIRLLHDAGATRSSILEGLDWLKAQAAEDLEATVIVYYSGHGAFDPSTNQYYLLQHDFNPSDVPNSALSAQEFTQALRQITAQRLLVVIDSCHAEGMATAKEGGSGLPADFVLPKGFIDALKQGEGRVVFTSCRGKQQSWIRRDKTMSIYTFHLIEALKGAANIPGDEVVRISNLMNHLGKTVPESVRAMYQAEQIPFFDQAAEDFAVALLQGGKGLPDKPQLTVERNQVFISYAYEDKAWLEKLLTMLTPLMRKGAISVWNDTQIKPGSLWKEEIKNALVSAKVAVLLVSPYFLASDFIAVRELPPLLKAAKNEGLQIVWVYLSACMYEETEIADYQAAHDISRPLDSLTSAEQNRVWLDICNKIKAAANA